MKVSIITVTYNSVQTFSGTIKSIQLQSYPNIEYIVVDGGSTDGTVDLIKTNENTISNWISEPDNGIYDAMNKGVELATGDIIAFLNADDFYAYNDAIKDVVDLMRENEADSCYSDLEYVYEDNTERIARSWKSKDYESDNFLKGWMPPHPTFFVKKEMFKKYGKFKLDIGTAADYELMLRFLYKHEISVAYLSKTLVKMRVGGISNSSISNRLKANLNDRKAWKMNRLKPKFYTLTLKPIRKIFQFF